MKPKDIFPIAIKLLGLVFLYDGLKAVPPIFFGAYLAIPHVIFFLALAWWLLGGAKLLMKRAYPESASQSPGTAEAPPIKSS